MLKRFLAWIRGETARGHDDGHRPGVGSFHVNPFPSPPRVDLTKRGPDVIAAPPTPAPPTTPSAPAVQSVSAAWWRDGSDGTLAVLEVVLIPGRASVGTLVGLDDWGGLVNGPWPAVGTADHAMATGRGNPGRDPLLPFGHTPTGEYRIEEVLPSRLDTRGVSLFGPHRAFRIQPVSGQAALADANGRTCLLIHGGPDGEATDGSIRVPDHAMAALLRLFDLRDDGDRPIRVVVREGSIAHAAAWRTVPGTMASPEVQAWLGTSSHPRLVAGIGSTSYSQGTRSTTSTYDYQADDTFPWWLYYGQMYGFDHHDQVPFDGRRAPGDVYPLLGPDDFTREQTSPQDTNDDGRVTFSGHGMHDTGSQGSGPAVVDQDASSGPGQLQGIQAWSQGEASAEASSQADSSWSPDGGAYGR